ncbi:FliM/FliN family flagellar motor C-terminal domain-containing protein [Qipengyuania sp. MTN3-11]|uniref:FliM/FliN family flagellar motor C-terminal domain-containing protein n=1 Tax=Qipengyuania sp. MTN3-11 TaxID=3056557 RepID=UPI0036F292F4
MISGSVPLAAARAACHCSELLSRAAAPPDLEAEFARFAAGFAARAASELAAICDDRGLTADVVATGMLSADQWFAEVGDTYRNGFYSVGQERRGVLVSVRIGELVAQFERLLGGPGEIDEDCTVLPVSTARFARQFEERIADVLRGLCDGRNVSAATDGDQSDRPAPFAPEETVWTATVVVSNAGGGTAWKLRLAACNSTIGDFVDSRAVSPATGRTIGARGIDGSAIAEVDLPLRAVLVDVPMSIARLACLEPGSVIPVAVNRHVPLMTGDLTIAHGSVGELDDRVALELTQIHLSE